jgi:hypothetical protein
MILLPSTPIAFNCLSLLLRSLLCLWREPRDPQIQRLALALVFGDFRRAAQTETPGRVTGRFA